MAFKAELLQALFRPLPPPATDVAVWSWPTGDLTSKPNYCVYSQYETKGRCAPYFVISGAFKCGTTSLYKYLCAHPLVVVKDDNVVRNKETRMLAGLPIPLRDLTYEKYMAFFPAILKAPDGEEQSLTGEASPNYIAHATSPLNVRDVVPHAKIIHMIREPIQRAMSQIEHYQSLNVVPANQKNVVATALMDEAVAVRFCMERHKITPQAPSCEAYGELVGCVSGELQRGAGNPGPVVAVRNLLSVSKGLYWLQLCNWRKLNPDAVSTVVVAEEFYANTAAETARVARFLRLPDTNWTRITSMKYNVGREGANPQNHTPSRRLGLVPEAATITAHRTFAETNCALLTLYEPWNELLRRSLGKPNLWPAPVPHPCEDLVSRPA